MDAPPGNTDGSNIKGEGISAPLGFEDNEEKINRDLLRSEYIQEPYDPNKPKASLTKEEAQKLLLYIRNVESRIIEAGIRLPNDIADKAQCKLVEIWNGM